MHPDLPRLLDVQLKDRRLAELDARAQGIHAERATLDALLERGRGEVASMERTLTEMTRRRDEAEQKLDVQRTQHERRKQKLDQERNPRVAAQLLADVELGRNILAQEELEWLRLSEDVSTRSAGATAARERLASALGEQAGARAELDARFAALGIEVTAAQGEREQAASQLDKTLRIRYDRLRKSRSNEILVPADKGTCTGCYTAIPRSRIGKLQAEGILIDGCEMCGAIIYVAEPAV
jgi:predicted  nucleic acid-binding Zn-ribbon protein